MAAGNRISITTTKNTYVLYDVVDAATSVDNKALTPRYQLLLNGTQKLHGGQATRQAGAGGFIKFTDALKAFYDMVSYYEAR